MISSQESTTTKRPQRNKREKNENKSHTASRVHQQSIHAFPVRPVCVQHNAPKRPGLLPIDRITVITREVPEDYLRN